MTELTRRQFLAAGGGLAVAGALSGCGSPVVTSLTGGQPATADVIFWHLFGGGDGKNMATMIQKFQAATALSVESTLISWGNPYYTKLSLAASSGRPPDVGIAHLSRLPLLAAAGLVERVDGADFTSVGITKDKFTPAAWQKATVDGKVYAVPLDTHPFVLFYNRDLARRADLLGTDGQLKPLKGKDEFVGALRAMKGAGGSYGAVMSVTADPSTCWRFFMMLYSGIGAPIVSELGTKVTLDRAAAEETFAFIQTLSGGQALMPSSATPASVTSLFSQGKVGFLFEGEWQIPTYRGVKQANGKPLDFDVVPFPAILGPKPVAYADSHSLVIPTSSVRPQRRTTDAIRFVKALLDESAIWAGGGHIPAWLPVQKSKAFLEQRPQRNYIEAAFNAVYDPVAWYTGAGSDFQTAMGSVVAAVIAGQTTPANGVSAMLARLKEFSTARPPVS
jgi:multiple sugar transport system substrate-binding protein